MSEPIRKKNDISSAPTPQNTPASVTNSYLHSKQPNISTISEEDSELNKQLINNPILMSMIQGKLGSLVGKDSGYVSSLPKPIKNRVFGLKSIQQKQMKLEAEFQKELLALEKLYFSKYQPLYEQRKKIITGDLEPTTEEIEEGEQLTDLNDDEDEESKIEELKEEEDEEAAAAAIAKEAGTGIPGFWLTCLENLTTVADTITDRDSEVLNYLKDIRMEYLESPGFRLIFEFDENPFLSNLILSKSYYYQAELGYAGDFVYDYATGTEIIWKSPEQNVTLTIERRKQRNKHTKQTRTIEKLTPSDSFFNFFDPPKIPVKDEDEETKSGDESNSDDDEELESRLELDYQLGEEIKDRLIPRAIDWFTGEAVDFNYEDEEEEDFDDDEDSEEESGDEDFDEDEDDAEGAEKQQPPECKQT